MKYHNVCPTFTFQIIFFRARMVFLSAQECFSRHGNIFSVHEIFFLNEIFFNFLNLVFMFPLINRKYIFCYVSKGLLENNYASIWKIRLSSSMAPFSLRQYFFSNRFIDDIYSIVEQLSFKFRNS